MFLRIFTISLVVYQVTADCSDVNFISNTWPNGEQAAFSFEVPETTNGWKMTVTFDKDVSQLQVYNGKKLNVTEMFAPSKTRDGTRRKMKVIKFI